MFQSTKPLLAGVCAALVVGTMSASAASAQAPEQQLAKPVKKFIKDAQTVYKEGILKGTKAAERAGDKLRGISPVSQFVIDKLFRDPLRKRATQDIPAHKFPYGLSWPKRRQQRVPQFAPAPIFGRRTQHDPRYITRDGRRMTKSERVRVNSEPPAPGRRLETIRRPRVFEPQRIAPISKPKGVLMRLGIDPKTYRRGTGSKSLLNRIRSRS